MSAVATPAAPTTTGPHLKVWTVAEFHNLGDLGVFEGRRASLVDGQIIEEGPMNHPHATAGTKTEDELRERFGRGWHVRVQKPLVFGLTTDPEPDVAIVRGRPSDYSAHPITADLVVEIADSSLRYDMTDKMSLYAAGGITDYWVLDVTGRLVVYRDPVTDPTAKHGASYRTVRTYGPTDTIIPLAAPHASVKVADLLP